MDVCASLCEFVCVGVFVLSCNYAEALEWADPQRSPTKNLKYSQFQKLNPTWNVEQGMRPNAQRLDDDDDDDDNR
jgi:hypothetical protein